MNSTIKFLKNCPKHDEDYSKGWNEIARKSFPDWDENSRLLFVSIGISYLSDVGIIDLKETNGIMNFKLTELGEKICNESN